MNPRLRRYLILSPEPLELDGEPFVRIRCVQTGKVVADVPAVWAAHLGEDIAECAQAAEDAHWQRETERHHALAALDF